MDQYGCTIRGSVHDHLGIGNIRTGSSLPVFAAPSVLDVLVKNFNILRISTPDEDLKAVLG
jgi:hydroxylamine reductase